MSGHRREFDAAHWRRAGTVFHELVELDPVTRSERLDRLGDTDPALRDAVEALLAGDAAADARLPRPGFGIDVSALQGHDPLLLNGQIIGRFRVIECVASGGMGAVYRAEDTRLAREVALKFPLFSDELTTVARERIIAEARLAGALEHPNVCPIYEIGESVAGPFFVMPLYQGETLKQRLARTPSLAPEQAMPILSQVAAGLACAHAAGITHGDLKPGNVMLLPDGGVRLLDFGLARLRSADLSRADARYGTTAYMSPEQIRGERVDERADLWSLGVMLYEMIAGIRPFAGETDTAVLHAVVHAAPASLTNIAPAIPAGLVALTHSLLAKDPRDRPRSASFVVDQVAAIAGDEIRTAPRLRFAPIRRRGVVVLACAAAVILGSYPWRDRSTLIGRGQLAPHDTLVLADFDAGTDSVLGRALTLLVRREFDDVRSVSLMPSTGVDTALRAMRQPPGTTLTPDLARELAIREGARGVVAGQSAPLGSGFVVTLRLVDAKTAAVLASASASAPNAEHDLVSAIAGLAEKLRRQIGEPRGSGSETRTGAPRKRLTTTSLAALRLLASTRKLPLPEQIARTRRALALDSTFAYAWLVFGNQLSGINARTAVQDSAFTTAYRLRDQLTTFERAQVESFYWQNVWRDQPRARAALELALAQDSTLPAAVPLNLVDRLNDARMYDRAEALGRRFGGRKDLENAVVGGILRAEIAQGHQAAVDSTLASLAARRGPDDPGYLAAARRMALNRLHFAEADSLLARSIRISRGPGFAEQNVESQLLRLYGRPSEAERVRLRHDSLRMVVAVAAGARIVPEAERLIDRARDDLWLRDRRDRAAARLDSLLPMLRNTNDLGDRLLLASAASLEAAAGNPAAAHALLERAIRGADQVAQRALIEPRHAALGEIALAEGRYAEAMTHFRASDIGPDSLPSTPCAVCVLPHLARTSERAGWTDSSRIFWERYVTEAAVQRLDTDQWFLVMAYRRLAEAYTRLGNVTKADEYRRRLADLRRDPDPDIAHAPLAFAPRK